MVKAAPERAMKKYGEIETQLRSFLTSTIYKSEGIHKISKNK
jgi:hypothetical protein